MEVPAPSGSFGPYQILERLGAGGMAETALAVRRGPGGFEQHVCLKRILPAFSEDERFRRMFLSEARLAARLRHANIVQVYDFGQHAGAYYLALELVDGTDLRKLVRWLHSRGESLTAEQVVFVGFELLAALSYAHDLELDGARVGLVHRDVTPSNILMSRRGEVKLADFGIAKATESAAATRSGSVKGKVPYMSPEQASGAPVDSRTDLFATGVILYELLCGRRPFDGGNDTATLMNLARGAYQPIREHDPSVPETLAEVIEQLLEHDPDRRFSHADDVADALAAIAPPPSVRRTVGGLVAQFQDSDDRRRGLSENGGPSVDKGARGEATASGVRSTGAEEAQAKEPRPARTIALGSSEVPGGRSNDRGEDGRSRFRRRVLGVSVGALVTALMLLAWSQWRGARRGHPELPAGAEPMQPIQDAPTGETVVAPREPPELGQEAASGGTRRQPRWREFP